LEISRVKSFVWHMTNSRSFGLLIIGNQYTGHTAMSSQKQLTSVQHLTFFSDGILRQKKRW